VLGEDDDGATVLGSLRRGDGGAERFSLSLAEAHVAGAPLDWTSLFGNTAAQRVPLPTYPFQRERHWLGSAGGGPDAADAGLVETSDGPLASKLAGLSG